MVAATRPLPLQAAKSLAHLLGQPLLDLLFHAQ
jgi:hypothetical protein